MKKLHLSLLALGAASCASYGCVSAPAEPHLEKVAKPLVMTTEKQSLVSGYNALGFSLLRQRVAENKNANVLLSPLSIATALAMVQGGASGNTQTEMARVLGTGNLDEKTREADNAALFSSLQNASDVQLSLANSLWINQGFQIKPDFQKRTETVYDAKVSALDFSQPNAPQQINDWVKASTRGKIDKMIDRLAPNDEMVLMNAVYFKGNWLEKFDPRDTANASFFASDGKRDVPMMRRSDNFNYLENAEMQAVALPYKGRRMSLYLLLPRENNSLEKLLASLDAKSFDALANKMTKRKGSVSLPRFKMQDDINLTPPLKTLGMTSAFGLQADFSRIAPQLFISGARHKAVIEVNETGTEAAAATSIGMAGSAMPMNQPEPFVFVANRPFLLALRDNQSGALLFLGAVKTPETLK